MHYPEMANLGVIRAAYQTFNDGEPGRLLNLFDPQVRLIMPNSGNATAHLWFGRDGVVRYFALAARCELFEPSEFLTSGNSVIVRGRLRHYDRATQQVQEQQWVHIAALRDGLIAEFQVFEDRAQATFLTSTQVY